MHWNWGRHLPNHTGKQSISLLAFRLETCEMCIQIHASWNMEDDGKQLWEAEQTNTLVSSIPSRIKLFTKRRLKLKAWALKLMVDLNFTPKSHISQFRIESSVWFDGKTFHLAKNWCLWCDLLVLDGIHDAIWAFVINVSSVCNPSQGWNSFYYFSTSPSFMLFETFADEPMFIWDSKTTLIPWNLFSFKIIVTRYLVFLISFNADNSCLIG